MKLWTLFWLTLAFTVSAHANTFVGNGGNEGDVELTVTLMQIQETFTAISKKAAEETPPNLCECNKMYKGRPICEPLAALSDEQTRFCNKSLYKVTPAVLKLVSARENIHFRWTNATIEVNDGSRQRDADAVANRERREITINQQRFMHMQPAERVFLLTHELIHFTDLDGQPLTDKGAVGPFAGDDGARTLVNSMAAAAGVMQGAYPKEIKGYKAKLHRSQAWKPFWVTLDFGSGAPTADYTDRYQFNNYNRGQLSFRYQWSNWGIMAAYRHEWQDGAVLDTIKTSEMIDSFGVGPTYRIFLSSDPLTFWGQSHILIHTLVEAVHGEYAYHEDVPGAPTDLRGSYRTTVLGGTVGVSYYLPLFFGMWTYLGVNYEYHPYQYTQSTPVMNYNNNLFSGNIGVGYAF